MHLLRYKDLPITAWKNGGGVTREIVSARGDGEGTDFFWRVSIATISASGPFSQFDGIDRTIVVLSGNGIRLSHPDGTTKLTTTTVPYTFAGETPIYADVIDGETTDLNAMSQRGGFRQQMRKHLVSTQRTLHTTADQNVLVFCGSMSISFQNQHMSVTAFDAAVDIPIGSTIELSADGPTPYYLITFHQVDQRG